MELDNKQRLKMESDIKSDNILNKLSMESDNNLKGPNLINNQNKARLFNLKSYQKRLRKKGGCLKGKFLKAYRP